MPRSPFSGFRRLDDLPRQRLKIFVDGKPLLACAGESVLTALNADIGYVRSIEGTDEKRSGFCLMGACQDCWLWRDSGERVRACTSLVQPGLRLRTEAPEPSPCP